MEDVDSNGEVTGNENDSVSTKKLIWLHDLQSRQDTKSSLEDKHCAPIVKALKVKGNTVCNMLTIFSQRTQV